MPEKRGAADCGRQAVRDVRFQGVKQTLLGHTIMSIRDALTVLIIQSCLNYDTHWAFGHREGAYVASSWNL